MISRGTLIAALFALELAVVGEAIVAIRGGLPHPWDAPWSVQRTEARTVSESRLVEDGPHRVFDAGARPALTVDIGYADLTILTAKKPEIDVSVSSSTDFGAFRATAPIVAREVGETIRVTTNGGRGWSMGDNRMVTVLVPPETHVTVVHAGDIKADGLRADASFTSIGKGSVTVDDYDASALRVASSDGGIVLQQIVAARLDATSSSGIEGSALQVRDGKIESDDRVTLGFAPGTDALVTADASDGKVKVSGFGTAASPATGDDDSDSSSRTVRAGAADGHFNVHSSDGDIMLARESGAK